MITTHPQVHLNDAGELILQTADGPRAVRAHRSFPWTDPQKFIVLREDVEEDAQELAAVEDLADLPPQTRAAIEAWLARHTFIPRITRVLLVKSGNNALLFHLDTDRGERRIKVLEREDMRPLPDGRTLIRDASGVVYELPPISTLDRGSQEQLRSVL
jgi:hypothetical protein